MTLNTFALSLSLSPTEIDGIDPASTTGEPAMMVQTLVLIDGKPLTLLPHPADATVVIDLADVLLAGEFADTFEPMTCSCGHAGCARIDDPVTVQHLDGRIVWHFPVSYIPRLAARGLARADDSSATFTFEATAYRASVAAAIDQVEAWEASHEPPVMIAAHALLTREDAQPIRALVAQWRRSFITWQARRGTPEEYLGTPDEQRAIEAAVTLALNGAPA